MSKAIDKAAGAEREVVATVRKTPSASSENMNDGWRRPWADGKDKTMAITAPATDAARLWSGYGTALKPAWEIIILARKPLDGTVAQNVLKWGAGALNVDGCRIEGPVPTCTQGQSRNAGTIYGEDQRDQRTFVPNSNGRFPANLLLDEESAAALDQASGDCSSPWIGNPRAGHKGGKMFGGSPQNYGPEDKPEYRDSGGASRFFYCAKSSRADRGKGNTHPTVKPVDLMRYLCRLVTPRGGLILDPFAGSGTTLVAAEMEGFRCVGLDLAAEYVGLGVRRLKTTLRGLPL